MNVALRQPVAQAALPRSRLASASGRAFAECSNSAAAGRLGRGARSAVFAFALDL
jgi:hypothetical protein